MAFKESAMESGLIIITASILSSAGLGFNVAYCP